MVLHLSRIKETAVLAGLSPLLARLRVPNSLSTAATWSHSLSNSSLTVTNIITAAMVDGCQPLTDTPKQTHWWRSLIINTSTEGTPTYIRNAIKLHPKELSRSKLGVMFKVTMLNSSKGLSHSSRLQLLLKPTITSSRTSREWLQVKTAVQALIMPFSLLATE